MYSSTVPLTSTLDGGGWSTPRPGRLPRAKPGTHCIGGEAGWAPGPVWTGAENLAPNGFRSPDRLARSESLYWLSYPGPHNDFKNFSPNQTIFQRVSVLGHCHLQEILTCLLATIRLFYNSGVVANKIDFFSFFIRKKVYVLISRA